MTHTWDELLEFRGKLEEAEQRSQSAYDRNLIALSGGGIAVSFSLLGPLIDPGTAMCKVLLFIAWASWAMALVAGLFSHAVSTSATRKMIGSVDVAMAADQRIADLRSPGLDLVTAWLNNAGGLLFALGLVSLLTFAGVNL